MTNENQFGIFAIEQTSLYPIEYQEKYGRIFEICTADLTIIHHFCSPTKLYFLEPIRMEYEKQVSEADDIAIQETLSEADYYSRHIFDRAHDLESTADYDNDYKLFKEHHVGNHVFQYDNQAITQLWLLKRVIL